VRGGCCGEAGSCGLWACWVDASEVRGWSLGSIDIAELTVVVSCYRAGKLGGYKVQAKTSASAKSLVSTALALQQAGISLLVLECIPPPVAAAITELIDVPTIGIGAGNVTDGQVLVMGDAMTFTEGTHRAK